ncbi:MAG: hypothetical protein AUH85_02055 [Chloroflexi bacterium 13_1_40CM_4_68_4]|nr:MAG: hypothetical protein AUH85_02055 [Chloroflexi bacterium 13_1_40CM_4_68_4]
MGTDGAIRAIVDRAERHLAVQYAVIEALAGATRVADASRRILPEICGALGWEVGALWLVDESRGLIRCHDLWSAHPERTRAFEEVSRGSGFPPGIGLPGRVWSRREPVWVPDIVADTNFPRAAAATDDDLHGAFGVPVRSGERFLGMLEFFDREIHAPDDELLRLFSAIGAQIGQAIERIAAEEGLRASEARLRAMIGGSLVAIIGIDADGRVIEWNAQAEALFGWSREETLGRALTATIIPERYRDRHRAGLARFLRTGDGHMVNRRVEIEALHKSGREMAVELAITAVPIADGCIFSAFLQDIGERKRDEERLRFLAEAGAVLATSLDYETTLARVAQLALPMLADYCFIDLADERGRLRRVAMAFAEAPLDARWREMRDELAIPRQAEHPTAEVMRTGRPTVFNDIGQVELEGLARSPQHLRFLREFDVKRWMAVPLVARGKTLGVMGFGIGGEDGRWKADEVRLAEEIARRAALAVENARLYGETREAVRTRDEFLATVSHDLRNPLAAVKGLAQLLRRRVERSSAPELRAFADPLDRIDASATRMKTLLDELVEVSGLRIGQPIAISRAPVDLVALAREAADAFPQDERHVLEISADPPTLVASVDAGRIERVFGNLLTNAIKYSPRGARVRIALSHADGEAIIRVSDEGVGIPGNGRRPHRGQADRGAPRGTDRRGERGGAWVDVHAQATAPSGCAGRA